MITTIKNLSHIPVPTWKWLNINSTSLQLNLDALDYNSNPVKQCPDGATIKESCPENRLHKVPIVLKQTAALVAEEKNHNLHITVEENAELTDPIIIEYQLGEAGQKLINRLHIDAKAGSKGTVVLRYSNDSDTPITHAGYVSINVGKGAELQFVSAQLLGKTDTHLDGVCSEVAEDGHLHLVLAEMGSEQAISGADIRLMQNGAFAQLDSVYLGTDKERRDLNYRICYEAPETEGYISANGALSGEAHKTMKSTIDFISGAAGSKGREEEYVLVLSDKVINMSSPLLLCGEENVEGQHATSIGRPDKYKLFYLMSRGLSEMDARKLLVEAALTPVLEGIGIPELEEELLNRAREGMAHGE